MIDEESPGRRLRDAVTVGTISLPGAPIALVAKLAEEQGFEAVYLSGAAMSAGLLAVPDIGLFSIDELAAQTRLLADASTLPVVVDADTGFGGPSSVAECVRRLEEAGAAAIQIEDQSSDKRCGHLAGKRLVGVQEMSEKVLAACQARRSSETVIIARSDARGVEGIDACIARLGHYREAGADWLFPEGLTSREEFHRVAKAFDVPLVANMTEFGVSPLIGREDLASMGYAAVLYPVTLLRVAMKAMEAALAVLGLEGTQESLLDLMQSRQELYDLLGYDPSRPVAEGSWRPNDRSRLA
ncbi:MAG: oxaloacetate decarboxylase [Planctomycetaceae bacterium]